MNIYNMYTVKELIEALLQCPPEYKVVAVNSELSNLGSFEHVGINNNRKTVDLFLSDLK